MRLWKSPKQWIIGFIILCACFLLFGAGYWVRDSELLAIQEANKATSIYLPPKLISNAMGHFSSEDKIEVHESLSSDTVVLSQEESLVLLEHKLDEDDDGLFIHGTIKNSSGSPYDTVQVEFELCGNEGKAYHVLRERTPDGLDNGEIWAFTVYIPYTERNRFASYRFHSLTGVRQ